jgi:hypothetical protein
MTDHDDAQLDAAIEALARQESSPEHVARILARTGPAADDASGRAAHPSHSLTLRPRWVLPIAAAVLVALGATWQVSRHTSGLDALIERAESQSVSSASGWGVPEAIDRPVLPPQAYWGMDAFEEWNSLRPGSGFRAPGSEDGRTRARHRSQQAGPPTLAWVPEPTGLPPIDMPSIAPAPLVVAPLAALEDIALAEIPVEPIVIAPLIEEEKP